MTLHGNPKKKIHFFFSCTQRSISGCRWIYIFFVLCVYFCFFFPLTCPLTQSANSRCPETKWFEELFYWVDFPLSLTRPPSSSLFGAALWKWEHRSVWPVAALTLCTLGNYKVRQRRRQPSVSEDERSRRIENIRADLRFPSVTGVFIEHHRLAFKSLCNYCEPWRWALILDVHAHCSSDWRLCASCH